MTRTCLRIPWLLGLIGLLGLLGPPTRAQEPNIRRLEIEVTAVSGKSIYIDRGREDKLEIGDRLQLFPAGSPRVGAVIRSVSRASARAELNRAGTEVDVGTRGEVWVPESRFAPPHEEPAPQPTPAREPPATTDPAGQAAQADQAEPKLQTEPGALEEAQPPVWEYPPEEWDTDLPLLAPAHVREPEERDWRYRGRVFTGFDYTKDNQYGNTYDIYRSGVDLEIENLLKQGGIIQFDAEYYSRSAKVDNGSNSDDTDFLLRRASYRWGGIRGRPDSWEVGRFLQAEFPELGLLDGAEYVHQLDSGSRLGASAGFLTEPNDDSDTGDDLAASVFYRYVSDPDETFAFGTAYQKSWHNGDADRDLLINTLDYYANRNTTVHATTWVDFYTSGDDRKDSSVELSQMYFDARHRTDAGNGAGVFASYLRWPDIERDEYQGLTDEQIDKNKVGRVGANGWLRTSKRTRLHTRGDFWKDQDDSGWSGSLRWSLRDILYKKGEVSFEVYGSEGKFNNAAGGRIYANRRFNYGFLNLYWDSTNFKQDNFDGSQGELLQNRVGFSYDTVTLKKWDISLWGEKRLGDEQDSWSMGIFLQRTL